MAYNGYLNVLCNRTGPRRVITTKPEYTKIDQNFSKHRISKLNNQDGRRRNVSNGAYVRLNVENDTIPATQARYEDKKNLTQWRILSNMITNFKGPTTPISWYHYEPQTICYKPLATVPTSSANHTGEEYVSITKMLSLHEEKEA